MPYADALMAGRLELSPHGVAHLPANPTWAEDPKHDRNWQFQYQTLRFTWDLFAGWSETGDKAYLDRGLFLLHDWVRDNPRTGGRSEFSWNDHATAWRTIVLACAAEIRPQTAWIRDALRVHGATLADPSFYVGHSNHALNQNRGLLAAACVLGRDDWKRLATTRLAALIAESVDVQGVTNEQALYYEWYNLSNYRRAAEELDACGIAIPAAFSRLDAMPDFLAHATMPDALYATIGDTSLNAARVVSGTVAEYAATAGVRGPKPATTFALFDAGYAFGRTGWGESRDFEDEVAWSARFGPGIRWHGHADHLSITMYGFGRRLIENAGIFGANGGPWRRFALSRAANNVVTVDGIAYDPSAASRLLREAGGDTFDDLALQDRGYRGVNITRRIVFSHALGWMLVDDRAAAASAATFRQLWHLEPGANPVRKGGTIRTRFDGGNLSIVQLRAVDAIHVVEGRTNPIQGWISTTLNDRQPAPTVEAIQRGRQVRYLTLLIPKPSARTVVRVTDRFLSGSTIRFTVWVGGVGERVTITAGSVSIEPPA